MRYRLVHVRLSARTLPEAKAQVRRKWAELEDRFHQLRTPRKRMRVLARSSPGSFEEAVVRAATFGRRVTEKNEACD